MFGRVDVLEASEFPVYGAGVRPEDPRGPGGGPGGGAPWLRKRRAFKNGLDSPGQNL